MGFSHLPRLAIAAGIVLLTSGAYASGAEPPAGARTSEAVRLRAQALEAGYNLDHAEALALFRAAIAADPDDPASHRLYAATLWIASLFQQGAVTVDDYLGQTRTQVSRRPLSADVDSTFRNEIRIAPTLAERRVRENPSDADARFQVGAAHSFLASYIATVEGRGLAGFRAARRAYTEHERVLDLDANRKDAGMVVGMYRYGVSTLPAYWRVFARIAGFGGGRERGIRMVEAAASYRSDVQPTRSLRSSSSTTASRRYDDALRVIGRLRDRYPRNRLLWLEAGSTALRAARAADACRALEGGSAYSQEIRGHVRLENWRDGSTRTAPRSSA